jgi:hypothetical protein
MHYSRKPRFALELVVISSKCLQNVLHTGEHQGVNRFLIFPGEFSEFTGQGKGNQVVLSRQSLAELIFYPLLTFMVLTVRAISVAAGMGEVEFFTAIVTGAFDQHMGRLIISTSLHGMQCFFMPRQNTIFVSGRKTTFKLVDNRGEKNHCIPPHLISKEFTRVLMA